MGTSHRYSSASNKPDIADASGSSPITAADTTPELLLALARVESSLRLLLAHIATIQREMGINQSLVHDVPLKPDDSWNSIP